jgi:Putative prokaryotic signal transducing protein
MLKVLSTASNPVEQSLLLARLSDAGIPCMRGAGGARAALGSGRDILVEEEDLARAQKILKEDDEGFDEEELARLSEEAGRQAAPRCPQPAPTDHVGPPTLEVPAKTHSLFKAFERLIVNKDKTNSPFGR